MTAVGVTLGGINFNGAADGNGTIWLMEDLDGYDFPPVKQVVVEGTARHGGVMASALLGPRPMTLKGLVKATTEANFWTAWAAFDAAFKSIFATQTMQVTEGGSGVVKRLGVVTTDRPRKRFYGTGSFTYELPLKALDPLKYSDVQNSASIPGTITNVGDFESYPVLTLTAGGNYTITNTTQGAGAIISIVGAPAGTVLDFKNRTALSGTTDVYSIVSSQSVWWALLPGANIITVAGGAASIAWRDAWL